MSVITIERRVLARNEAVAARNRELFRHHRLFVVNVVSSPGAGKTRLLERTIERLKDRIRIGVIEGDVQTDLDAQRVARYGVPVVQIVTNGGCHLDAQLVHDAVATLDLSVMDLLVIENVGNLVCPASYDLGEALKVVVLSTTEGDDKPLKYPAMFRHAAVLVVNKIDLLPYIDCNLETLERNALQINPSLTIFETSCTTLDGIDAWCGWVQERMARTHA
ncbi:MAG: hydrogenase nickel incorporation protein HypB [Vicinamibacterales bacterium]